MKMSKIMIISFLGMLELLFVGLKLADFISWSWWWIFSPLWITLSLLLAASVIGLILVFREGHVKYGGRHKPLFEKINEHIIKLSKSLKEDSMRKAGTIIVLIGSIILIAKAGWMVWIAIMIMMTGNNIVERWAE